MQRTRREKRYRDDTTEERMRSEDEREYGRKDSRKEKTGDGGGE